MPEQSDKIRIVTSKLGKLLYRFLSLPLDYCYEDSTPLIFTCIGLNFIRTFYLIRSSKEKQKVIIQVNLLHLLRVQLQIPRAAQGARCCNKQVNVWFVCAYVCIGDNHSLKLVAYRTVHTNEPCP